jgi:hypothetical protein
MKGFSMEVTTVYIMDVIVFLWEEWVTAHSSFSRAEVNHKSCSIEQGDHTEVRPTGGKCFMLAHSGRHPQQRRYYVKVREDYPSDRIYTRQGSNYIQKNIIDECFRACHSEKLRKLTEQMWDFSAYKKGQLFHQ